MTPFRIQELEFFGFEWDCYGTALSMLADYREIHGHCNDPKSYSTNSKLGLWVNNQRSLYRLHMDGNSSSMTPSRIQALDSLGFEWKPAVGRRKRVPRFSTTTMT
jgi:hypothetical protein